MAPDHAPTILVVEDDPDIQDLLQEMLADEGYRVLLASDGLHGLSLAAADQPDVILLDMGLPTSSGVAVLDQLRDDQATTHIPVLALTTQPLPAGDGPRGLAGWIEKPFALDELLTRVGHLTKRQALIVRALTAPDDGS
jgi:DNA-binding response OmpR family regulator